MNTVKIEVTFCQRSSFELLSCRTPVYAIFLISEGSPSCNSATSHQVSHLSLRKADSEVWDVGRMRGGGGEGVCEESSRCRFLSQDKRNCSPCSSLMRSRISPESLEKSPQFRKLLFLLRNRCLSDQSLSSLSWSLQSPITPFFFGAHTASPSSSNSPFRL